MEMPPESNVTPLPTKAMGLRPEREAPFQRMRATRGSRALPWATPSSARIRYARAWRGRAPPRPRPACAARAPRRARRFGIDDVGRLGHEVARQQDALGDVVSRRKRPGARRRHRRSSRSASGGSACSPSSPWCGSGRSGRRPDAHPNATDAAASAGVDAGARLTVEGNGEGGVAALIGAADEAPADGLVGRLVELLRIAHPVEVQALGAIPAGARSCSIWFLSPAKRPALSARPMAPSVRLSMSRAVVPRRPPLPMPTASAPAARRGDAPEHDLHIALASLCPQARGRLRAPGILVARGTKKSPARKPPGIRAAPRWLT